MHQGIPFEVKIPNEQTLEAMQELKDPETRKNLKRFSNVGDLMTVTMTTHKKITYPTMTNSIFGSLLTHQDGRLDLLGDPLQALLTTIDWEQFRE